MLKPTVLAAIIKRLRGPAKGRARAAPQGYSDAAGLAAEEFERHLALLGHGFAHPTEAEIAAMAAIGRQAGAVGYDDEGRLVRSDTDGKLAIVKE